MKLYFVRHGESAANTWRVISNRESRFGLTELGKRQANTLVEGLKDIPITAIFSSPVLRARQTADILSHSFGQPYQVSEALREYDCGILEEQSDEASWGLHREIYEDWTLHHNYQRKPNGGECFLDIRNRFLPLIKSLADDDLHVNQHILLVGHGGIFQLMLPLVLTNIEEAFVRSHGINHIDCIIAEQQPAGLVCLQWGQFKFDNI